MTELAGTRIHITGIVQGVGFRPFVYGLANRYELYGWVRNTSAGVDIEVDGSPDALVAFRQALQNGEVDHAGLIIEPEGRPPGRYLIRRLKLEASCSYFDDV